LKEFSLTQRPSSVPVPLWERLVAVLEDNEEESARPSFLTKVAAERLGLMTKDRGEMRIEAFDLLVVDALVTYACDLTAQEDDMVGSLDDIVDILKVENDSC